jgi:hypothetical protein
MRTPRTQKTTIHLNDLYGMKSSNFGQASSLLTSLLKPSVQNSRVRRMQVAQALLWSHLVPAPLLTSSIVS